MPAKPVFISYSREDLAIVIRLKEALEANGISIWFDHEKLKPGNPDWQEAIESGIPQCKALIYIATPHAKDSKYIRSELHLAIQRKIPIYPFWVAGAEWIEAATLDVVLAHYIDARNEQADYGDAFGELLKVLKQNDPPEESTQPAIVPVINPLVATATPTTPTPVETTSLPEPIPQDTPPERKGDGFKRFRPVAIILIAALLLSGASAVFLKNRSGDTSIGHSTPTVTPTQRPSRWEIVANPNLGSKNVLYGVDAIAADNVWAAGYYRNNPSSNPQFTLIEHWDGSSWTQVASPNGKADTNVLNGIMAVAPSDVWAVGDSGTSSLIEHWNGSSWVTVPSPNVGAYRNYLDAVSARSTNDVWAVGDLEDKPDGPTRTLIEHWNGSSWQVTPSPNLGSGNNILYGVTTLATGDVWAAGFSRSTPSSSSHPLIEHWNGSSWQIVSVPSVGSGDNLFNGIAAVAANDIWAAGSSKQTSKDLERSLIEHWDGSSWTVIASPNIGAGDNVLYGFAVLKSDDVWAAGGGKSTLIVHWDGSSWKTVTSLNIDPNRNILNNIAAVGTDDLWAVGVYGGASQTSSNYTLIEHWTNS